MLMVGVLMMGPARYPLLGLALNGVVCRLSTLSSTLSRNKASLNNPFALQAGKQLLVNECDGEDLFLQPRTPQS